MTDHTHEEVNPAYGVAPRAEGLDVLLAEAMEQHSIHDHPTWWMDGCHSGCAEQIAARLSRSDEREADHE